MKCPLLSAGEYTRNVSAPTLSCDCLKEECAWWNKGQEACAVLSIFDALNNLLYHIKDIEAKMPSGQSFVK